VARLPGVGKVTEEKPKHLEVQTIADLRRMDLSALEGRFGRYGVRLYELDRGIDNSEVVPDRPTQSISAEDPFEQDVLLTEMEPMIRKLAEHTWAASRKESRIARTVVLKLKTSEFKILTRSHTPGSPPASCEELTDLALSLLERVGLSPQQRFRLVGVGLSNFHDPDNASASRLFLSRVVVTFPAVIHPQWMVTPRTPQTYQWPPVTDLVLRFSDKSMLDPHRHSSNYSRGRYPSA
jgi:DNA polymerase IV